MKIRIDIDGEDFYTLWKYSYEHQTDNPEMEILHKILDGKLDRIEKRQLYSKSKTAGTPEEREAARREYLDRVGIPQNFRWS